MCDRYCVISSPICRIAMAIFKIESRIGLVTVMLLALIGSLLLADWHGFGGNPCSIDNIEQSTVTAGDMFNDSRAANSSEEFKLSGSGFLTSTRGSGSGQATEREWLWVDNDNNTDVWDTDNTSSSLGLELLVDLELCDSQSTSSHQCFWNPKSRVTGEHCTTCRPVCLSTQKSINFIQFSAGVFILTILLQPGLVFYSVVTSNITKKRHQVSGVQIYYVTTHDGS